MWVPVEVFGRKTKICRPSCTVITTYTPTHTEPDSLVKMVVEMQCNQSDVLYTTKFADLACW